MCLVLNTVRNPGANVADSGEQGWCQFSIALNTSYSFRSSLWLIFGCCLKGQEMEESCGSEIDEPDKQLSFVNSDKLMNN